MLRANAARSFSAKRQARVDGVDALRAELASGEWDRRFGALRAQPEFNGSLRLITNH